MTKKQYIALYLILLIGCSCLFLAPILLSIFLTLIFALFEWILQGTFSFIFPFDEPVIRTTVVWVIFLIFLISTKYILYRINEVSRKEQELE